MCSGRISGSCDGFFRLASLLGETRDQVRAEIAKPGAAEFAPPQGVPPTWCMRPAARSRSLNDCTPRPDAIEPCSDPGSGFSGGAVSGRLLSDFSSAATVTWREIRGSAAESANVKFYAARPQFHQARMAQSRLGVPPPKYMMYNASLQR
jgi:hypothetical protein